MNALEVDLAGERLQLQADRAVYWPRQRTLIVADVHLGKGAALRRAGVAVPSGSTCEDLARLSRLIADCGAERLLVLGDLFHARLVGNEPAMAAIDAFRARHAALHWQVLRGNHDRALGALPPHWRIDWHEARLVEPPFVFAHEPAPDARGYVLAGHVHPVVVLRTRVDALRLPVFWFARATGIGLLPAFGAFTGGYAVRPAPGDPLYAATPDGLVALPTTLTPEETPCAS